MSQSFNGCGDQSIQRLLKTQEMSVKDPFSSKTAESKPLRVVMEVVKTKKIVNSFTKAMRCFDMD